MSWKVSHIANQNGKVYEIKTLSLKQTNSYIGTTHQKMKVAKKHLDLLYERRANLMNEPVEKGKAQRKIFENLQFKEKKMNWSISNADEGARIKAIVLMALKHLENGADISLIEAILNQARDEE